MIFLFHGENQPALRDALLELRGGYDEVVFWDKELEELPVFMASPTLFASKSPSAKRGLVIIEDPDIDKVLQILESLEGKDIVLVLSDKIPTKKLPKSRSIKIRHFQEEIPKNVFPFLDALTAKGREDAFVQLHRLVREGMDTHFILAMMVWQMRNLARVRGGSVKGMHPYVLGKLRKLAKNFSQEDLSRVFSLLLEEDLAVKKGRADATTLDFLIDKLTAG
jgi:hypothetical protein